MRIAVQPNIKPQPNTRQLMDAIRILPYKEKCFLKTCIEKELSSTPIRESVTDKLLLGPTMSNEQYQVYEQLKNDFTQWTKLL